MVHTEAERGCAQPREDSEDCGVRLSDTLEACSQCQNIRIVSQFALNLGPNVARIGMLHLLLTLNSDLRSDAMQRASECKGRGRGGRVRNGGH